MGMKVYGKSFDYLIKHHSADLKGIGFLTRTNNKFVKYLSGGENNFENGVTDDLKRSRAGNLDSRIRLNALGSADIYVLGSGTYKDLDASMVLRTSSNELTLEKDSVFIPLTKDFLGAFSGIKEADQMLGKLVVGEEALDSKSVLAGKIPSFIDMAEFNSSSEVYDLLEKINSILLPTGIQLGVPSFEKVKVLINMPEVILNYIKDNRFIQTLLITSTPASEIGWEDLESSGYRKDRDEMKNKNIYLNPFLKSGFYPSAKDGILGWNLSAWFEVLPK